MITKLRNNENLNRKYLRETSISEEINIMI